LIAVLEGLDYWDDEMAEHIKLAAKNNDQIYGEYKNKVPSRTAALYKKWKTTKPS
jgi:hypothetical protein